MAKRVSCVQECVEASQSVRAPGHSSEASSYRDAALRLLEDSYRHSELAVRYAEKATSGAYAGPWRDLAEYQLRLASHELSTASVMVSIAMIHWQLAHDSQPSGKAEDSP